MKISCHVDWDLFVTSFPGVENCSPANVVVALVDFYTRFELHLETPEVISETKCVIPSLRHVLKHASDVLVQERILAWMKACELRIALVKK